LLTLSACRRRPKPYERRALILLAGCGGEGCTEAVMHAHGFTHDQLMKLERLGIVAKTTERVVSLQTFEVVRLFAFLVLRHEPRRMLWFAVTHNPTAECLKRKENS
jgi:hypothetical protein